MEGKKNDGNEDLGGIIGGLDDLLSGFDDMLGDYGIDPEEAREKREVKAAKKAEEEQENHIRVKHRMGHRQISRRLTSEKALEDEMAWHFKDGDCFHCFSWGDVDFLTYIKMVVRQQPVKYLAVSTWCMSGEDVMEIREWWRRGFLERADFFVGEIFKGSYPEAYAATEKFCREHGGKIVIFRNHAKVAIIVGEKFDCLIESSANVNTNPRSENTVVTVDRGLVDSYLELFSGIISYSRDFDDVEPYRREE